MFALVLAWWPVMLFLALPTVAGTIAVTIANRLESRLDHAIPDTLPMTAGRWLAKRIAQRRLPVQSIVADGVDGYFPRLRVIRLSITTHFKADPVYWAIAAHELGHARLWVEHRFWAGQHALRVLRILLVRVGIGLAVGGALHGVTLALAVAHACLALAVVLLAASLVEEAAASVLGHRELVASGLGGRELGAARSVMIAAFATYLATYAAYGVMLAQWSLVEPVAFAVSELTPLGTVLAAASSLVITLQAWASLVRLVSPPAAHAMSLPRALLVLGYAISVLAFVGLAWDAAGDPVHVACLLLALVGSADLWLGLLALPMLPITAAIRALARRLRGNGAELTPAFTHARDAGWLEIARGNLRLTRLAAKLPPSRFETGLTALALLPLVVAFWTAHFG